MPKSYETGQSFPISAEFIYNVGDCVLRRRPGRENIPAIVVDVRYTSARGEECQLMQDPRSGQLYADGGSGGGWESASLITFVRRLAPGEFNSGYWIERQNSNPQLDSNTRAQGFRAGT